MAQLVTRLAAGVEQSLESLTKRREKQKMGREGDGCVNRREGRDEPAPPLTAQEGLMTPSWTNPLLISPLLSDDQICGTSTGTAKKTKDSGCGGSGLVRRSNQRVKARQRGVVVRERRRYSEYKTLATREKESDLSRARFLGF